MQNVYDNSSELEKLVKAQYGLPDYIMMENAARTMADFIKANSKSKDNKSEVYILCGKGNNGGDGLALARLLQDSFDVAVICPDKPGTTEAATQFSICKNLGIKIFTDIPDGEPEFVVDCFYGTGFHGELMGRDESLLARLSKMDAIKIACDIPSALFFTADYTFTMGNLKFSLFSDKGKAACGTIFTVDLGVSKTKFQELNPTDSQDDDSLSLMPLPTAYLIDKEDMKLPFRTDRSANKGTYGHTAVFTGSKAGAGIMAATAAMQFGSGITSLIKTENTNLDQFKISPELMVSTKIPAKTTCIVFGPGLADEDGNIPDEAFEMLMNWFSEKEKPACVLDADVFNFVELNSLLEELNKTEGAQIILTPHLKEYEKLVDKVPNLGTLKNVTVVRKSANTFISNNGELYICADGSQSLAKGGSGDILAGMIGALLSQGYSAKDACITAVEAHALAGKAQGAENYSLTPEKLLTNLTNSLSGIGLEKK